MEKLAWIVAGVLGLLAIVRGWLGWKKDDRPTVKRSKKDKERALKAANKVGPVAVKELNNEVEETMGSGRDLHGLADAINRLRPDDPPK